MVLIILHQKGDQFFLGITIQRSERQLPFQQLAGTDEETLNGQIALICVAGKDVAVFVVLNLNLLLICDVFNRGDQIAVFAGLSNASSSTAAFILVFSSLTRSLTSPRRNRAIFSEISL